VPLALAIASQIVRDFEYAIRSLSLYVKQHFLGLCILVRGQSTLYVKPRFTRDCALRPHCAARHRSFTDGGAHESAMTCQSHRM